MNLERTGPTIRRPRHRQSISARLCWAFFRKQADLKPHRDRYGLTPKPDPDFETKCVDICAVYQAAPTAAEQGADRLDRRNDRYPGAGTGRQELANEAWARRTATERRPSSSRLMLSPARSAARSGYPHRSRFRVVRLGTAGSVVGGGLRTRLSFPSSGTQKRCARKCGGAVSGSRRCFGRVLRIDALMVLTGANGVV